VLLTGGALEFGIFVMMGVVGVTCGAAMAGRTPDATVFIRALIVF
jgi:hypothetical protein